MGCLTVTPSAADVQPRFYLQKSEGFAGEAKFFYRDHFRVYHIVRGYVTVSAENKDGIRLGYGDICILPPDIRHSLRVNTVDADLYAFSFSIDFVEQILQHQAGTGGVLSNLFNSGGPVVIAPVPVPMQSHLQNLMEFMRYEHERDLEGMEFTIQNCLATVLCAFSELLRAQQEIRTPADKSGILYAVGYVKDNFDKSLTTDSMAKLVNMSVKEFSARFKTFTGRTFHDFLNKVRIDKAAEILKQTGGAISFTELSLLCGYDNYVTFYRNFCKYTGGSPQDFLDACLAQK